jgi:hypothetical protein
MSKYPLTKSLRVYWLNLVAIFLTPLMTVLAMIICKPLWPVVFVGLAIFAVVAPYRFGKAPLTYVFTCQLLFIVGGFAMALGFWGLWALGVPEEVIERWWAETRN